MPLSSFSKQLYSVQFNGALPITIVVLEEVGFRRYKLQVGNKKLTTKSLKPLKIGERYWGDFSYTQEGMLRIGNLKLKPSLLQNEQNFLPLNSWDLVENISTNQESYFKNWLLDALDKSETRGEFKLLSSMLIALQEDIIHLPLLINGRPFLLQWRRGKNEDLNQNWVDFFFAFDTLGALKGRIEKQSISMEVLFAKTARVLEEKQMDTKEIELKITDNLLPLWNGDDALLDLKG